jgi:hypothetical protein
VEGTPKLTRPVNILLGLYLLSITRSLDVSQSRKRIASWDSLVLCLVPLCPELEMVSEREFGRPTLDLLYLLWRHIFWVVVVHFENGCVLLLFLT